jgi:hypothetical protein
VLPGIERQLLKKLEPSPERLLAVLHRWRDEAPKAGKEVTRIALAFEAAAVVAVATRLQIAGSAPSRARPGSTEVILAAELTSALFIFGEIWVGPPDVLRAGMDG